MIRLELCVFCRHNTMGTEGKHVCPAFPDGRPEPYEISTSKDCGTGIRFEPKEAWLDYCDEEFYREFS